MLRIKMDLSKFEGLTSDNTKLTADFRPLNFDALLNAGAFRVTNIGKNESYDPDPMAGFSIVSAYNDAAGNQTRKWPDNPYAYNIVREMFTKRPQDITPHKYLQIIESAKQLGIPDSQIFLNPKEILVNPFYQDPFNTIQDTTP
jgi:hypothetical protein